MPTIEPLNFSQPDNEMSRVADAERKKLLTKNDFKTSNQYSSVNPDALATGDAQGKGTGNFLDIFNQNAGAIQDIIERKTEITNNKFQPNKPYTTPSA